MFLRNKAIHAGDTESLDIEYYITQSFNDFVIANNFCAGFLCVWNENNLCTELVYSSNIPCSPFKGSKKESIDSFVRDCLNQHPSPHIHKFAGSPLWKEISAVKNIDDWGHQVLFVPAYILSIEFIFLCFTIKSCKFDLSDNIRNSICNVVKYSCTLLSSKILQDRIRTMEIYVREVGHDIASSVQAIVAKLRNVSKGLLQGSAAIDKIREAEVEIMSAYRTADTLGITVDPDYNITTGDTFDGKLAVESVIELCRSEAEERHIELSTEIQYDSILIWGDEQAIQSALIQLVLNAIKYARGSSRVTVGIEPKKHSVRFFVIDVGKPLDEEEKIHMWDFGWRGDKAKELHVNGSGIGLYTVKKIAKAHGGHVGFEIIRNNTICFYFVIPKDIISKPQLL